MLHFIYQLVTDFFLLFDEGQVMDSHLSGLAFCIMGHWYIANGQQNWLNIDKLFASDKFVSFGVFHFKVGLVSLEKLARVGYTFFIIKLIVKATPQYPMYVHRLTTVRRPLFKD